MCFEHLHQLQRDAVALRHAAHVEQGVAHTSECGVDAHARGVGNLLERELLVEAHVHHLALYRRQHVEKTAHVAHHLTVDVGVLDIALHKVVATYIREVVVLSGFHDATRRLVAIPVHDGVVGDTHHPRTELAADDVAALLETGDNLYEGLLEDVIGGLAVVNHEKDV